MSERIGEDPVVEFTEELIAEIRKLSKVFAWLDSSALKRRAIVLLLHDATKVAKKDINKILDELPEFESRYLKQPVE